MIKYLTEDFISEYKDYLEESASLEADNLLEDVTEYLSEAFEEFNEVFRILSEQFTLLENGGPQKPPPIDQPPSDGGNGGTGAGTGTGTGNGEKGDKNGKDNQNNNKEKENKSKELGEIRDFIKKVSKKMDDVERERDETNVRWMTSRLRDLTDAEERAFNKELSQMGPKAGTELPDYTPEDMIYEKKKLSSMPFPKNVVFFISAIIDWVKRLIIGAVTKLRNIVGAIFGASQIEMPDMRLFLSEYKALKATGSKLSSEKDKAITVTAYDINDIKSKFSSNLFNESVLEEDALLELEDSFGKNKHDSGANAHNRDLIPIVDINISSDMDELAMLLDHFFSIYDSAYGSNNEYLFGIDDVEMLLQVFKTAVKELSSGDVSPLYLAGRSNSPLIDAASLRVNLQKTSVNTQNIKNIYDNLHSRIQKTLRKITNKELLATTELGATYKFFSLATYEKMSAIIKKLTPRLKEMMKLKKDMERVQKKYEQLVSDLSKLQKTFSSMTNTIYKNSYQSSMKNLFDSARVVTQTISLRLTALTLIIKVLRDTKEAIMIANSMNKKSYTDLRKVVLSFRKG